MIFQPRKHVYVKSGKLTTSLLSLNVQFFPTYYTCHIHTYKTCFYIIKSVLLLGILASPSP